MTDKMFFAISSQKILISGQTRPAVMDDIKSRLGSGQGFALATLNLDHLVKMRHSPAFRSAYAAQDIVVADGNPIVWLSKLAQRSVELMPGSDLVVPLAELAAEAGTPIALLGSTEHSLAKAADALRTRVPGLDVRLCIAPPMGYEPTSDAAAADFQRIADAGARLVFLALGAPKQEIAAAQIRQLHPSIGCASIGASLDFLARQQRRAPVWVRKLALEWLWRAASNPRRLAWRYVQCMAILPGHAVQAVRLRRQTGKGGAS